MISDNFFMSLASIVICSFGLLAGCVPSGEETVEPVVEVQEKVQTVLALPGPVTLAIGFSPQDSTTYKVTVETGRTVTFEGILSDEPVFKGGHTGSKTEMVFVQQIESVDEKDNAVAKITIKGLKYLVRVRDKAALDFDNMREKNEDSSLAKLIGQSYTIKIAPDGRVVEIIDVNQAQSVVSSGTSGKEAALKLLSHESIKKRHTIPAMPVDNENQLSPGGNWSKTKAFSFGKMGSKSYEKIYSLKAIKGQGNQKIAVVEMIAIPTSEKTEQLKAGQTVVGFSKVSDSDETYTGQLELDLATGKVKNCIEELHVEWLIIDPTINLDNDESLSAARMSTTDFYCLEKID